MKGSGVLSFDEVMVMMKWTVVRLMMLLVGRLADGHPVGHDHAPTIRRRCRRLLVMVVMAVQVMASQGHHVARKMLLLDYRHTAAR